jgi:hypothetical protein
MEKKRKQMEDMVEEERIKKEIERQQQAINQEAENKKRK